jgi:AraC family transcriptional regulator of adaptative response/methylated-DNA-[protein]-cysteine methyltransferase
MITTLPPAAEMRRAYLKSDVAYNGLFYLGVRTTGIFCRPTCPARKPKPENVEYFATPREALTAGYRPCKRCRPLADDEQPAWARSLLADIEREPAARITEGDLRSRGIDPATVRRHFLRRYGMTFQGYARARRLGLALHQIREGASLDNVVFANGYESHSGFRDAFVRLVGKAPGRSRGQDCVTVTWLRSPLGPLVAGAVKDGVCLLEFSDRRMLEAQFATIRRRFQAPIVPGKNDHLARLQQELAEYFAGKLKRFTVPLVYPGTPFQVRVWDGLLRIPYGETRSYEELAADVGSPGAQRAVGRANGLNRIAIVIPCHRVINKDGNLGGYGGGLRRKEYLLRLEQGNDGVTQTQAVRPVYGQR